MAVTRANQHLEIKLLDKDDKNLGVMNMAAAKRLAQKAELKLVIIDDQPSPPVFKIMSGPDLHKLQIQHRDERRLNDPKESRVLKLKEIEINLGIADHDLDVRIKMIGNFYEKGHPIAVRILSKIAYKKEKNIPKLQEEFLGRFKKMLADISVPFKIVTTSEQMVSINIASNRAKETEVVKKETL